MIFTCLCCDHTEDIVKIKKSKGSQRCPKCKAAMAPNIVLYKVENNSLIQDKTEAIYRDYCNCPNARFCCICDLYKPSCEDLVFTPACLHWFFAMVDRSLHAFSHIGNTLYSLHPPESPGQPIPEEPDK